LPTAKQASKDFEMGRNFANKIWNAARFLLMNLDGYRPEAIRLEELPLEDRWILSRLATTAKSVTAQLDGYRFSEAARTVYDFTWSEFCDWYVEMSKGRLRIAEQKPIAQRVLLGVLDGILRLVHPIMPFVTESIWQVLNEAAFERGLPSPEPAAESVCIAPWPAYPEEWQDAAMETRMARMQELVGTVRETRNRYGIEPRTPLEVTVKCGEAVARDFCQLEPFIKHLAGIGALHIGPDVPKPAQAATQVYGEFQAFVSLAGLIDVEAEIARLEKQKAERERALLAARAKLANPGFVEKAKPEAVQAERERVAELEKQLETIVENLRDLRQE